MLLRSRTGRGRDGVGVWGSGDEYKGVEQVETGGAELAREGLSRPADPGRLRWSARQTQVYYLGGAVKMCYIWSC